MTDTLLNMQNARELSEEFIRKIPPYSNRYDGRGVVVCAGGERFFPCAWILFNMLRYVGCRLPIQMWHLDSTEVDDEMRGLLEPLGVECVDASLVHKGNHGLRFTGWELKPYAILHSPFREVLLLDADIVPARDPTYLFDYPVYKDTGALFWPDLCRLDPNRMIWSICGVGYQDEPEFESGQMVVDKERCWDAINLTVWYNYYSEFYYAHIYGDKDTFHMAWRKTGHRYGMAAPHATFINKIFFQNGFDEYVLFQHQKKWQLSDIEATDCHVFPEECLELLGDLRQKWFGSIRTG